MDKYVLDEEGNIKVEPDLLKWGVWFEDIKNTRICETFVTGGNVRVSTVFLGLDFGYGDTPILFETMIFGGEHDNEQWRYATKKQAVAGHERVVRMLQEIKEPIFKES
jgi:hypothetical protein